MWQPCLIPGIIFCSSYSFVHFDPSVIPFGTIFDPWSRFLQHLRKMLYFPGKSQAAEEPRSVKNLAVVYKNDGIFFEILGPYPFIYSIIKGVLNFYVHIPCCKCGNLSTVYYACISLAEPHEDMGSVGPINASPYR